VRPLESWNLFDPAVAEDPWEFYAALRARAPVYRMPMGIWIVSTHALCVQALRDPEAFSSRFMAALGGALAAAVTSGDAGGLAARAAPPADTLLTNDPPSHTRFRKLVNRAFLPRRVEKLAASIRELAHGLVDGFAARGRLELVREFAVPLPLTVIADQLGVPRAHLPEFKRWSDASVGPLGGLLSREEMIECAKLVVELQDYLAERCEERRRAPQDDLLSDLVHAHADGEPPLTTPEAVSILQQLLVAGNETTTNLIAAAVQFLLRDPAQLARLRADRSLLPNALEEALRLETPVQGMWRVTTRDVPLGGETIPKGSFVMLRYASANRDETVFPDPDRFDVARPNAREHLSFGLGIHYCVGAALARTEAAIALETLLDRLPGLRLAPGNDFRHQRSMLLRGLERLELEFDA
jgi:cytochrome P450